METRSRRYIYGGATHQTRNLPETPRVLEGHFDVVADVDFMTRVLGEGGYGSLVDWWLQGVTRNLPCLPLFRLFRLISFQPHTAPRIP